MITLKTFSDVYFSFNFSFNFSLNFSFNFKNTNFSIFQFIRIRRTLSIVLKKFFFLTIQFTYNYQISLAEGITVGVNIMSNLYVTYNNSIYCLIVFFFSLKFLRNFCSLFSYLLITLYHDHIVIEINNFCFNLSFNFCISRIFLMF